MGRAEEGPDQGIQLTGRRGALTPDLRAPICCGLTGSSAPGRPALRTRPSPTPVTRHAGGDSSRISVPHAAGLREPYADPEERTAPPSDALEPEWWADTRGSGGQVSERDCVRDVHQGVPESREQHCALLSRRSRTSGFRPGTGPLTKCHRPYDSLWQRDVTLATKVSFIS